MSKDINLLKAFIEQQLGEDGEEIAQLIYPCYNSTAESRSERVRESFQRIDECIDNLPFQQADEIRNAVYLACGEYEKLAFLDGIAVGAKLLLEFIER